MNEKHKDNPDFPLLSVVVPFYNAEKYFSKCLESLVNQTLKNIEIILIDDCSTDGSAKIAQEYAKRDIRIKILKHKKNKGQSEARNTGLKAAKGKYVAFLDHDDYLSTDIYEKAIYKAEEVAAIGVSFNVYLFNENKIKDFINIQEHTLIDKINERTVMWNTIYNRNFIQEIDLTFPKNRNIGDDTYFHQIFQSEAAKRKKKRVHIKDFGYYYRDTIGSASKQCDIVITYLQSCKEMLKEAQRRQLDDTYIKIGCLAAQVKRNYWYATLSYLTELKELFENNGITADFLSKYQEEYDFITDKLIQDVECLTRSPFIFWLKCKRKLFNKRMKKYISFKRVKR